MWEDPDDQQSQGVETQPGQGSLDLVGKEQYEQGAEEFTEIGAANHDLGIGAFVKNFFRESRGQLGFEVTMSEQWDGVSWDEPDEFAR